ncbi:hypothetical protein [Zavarzinia sp. CC-PAN008]|uniref:hypothetical protein n=1 Tax=Zavarzinia sp. CC-PAN008 TaxID=3243332 RepID=UPI003F7462AC
MSGRDALARAGCTLALPVFALVALVLGFDTNWDLRNYHLYNPWALLNGRDGVDILAAQRPTFYSPYLDVPFLLLAQSLPAWAVAAILGAVQGFNVPLLYGLGSAIFEPLAARWRTIVALACAWTGALGAVALSEAGTTFWDSLLSLFVIAGLWLAVRTARAEAPERTWNAVAAGLLLGLCAGLKQPMVAYCFGLCLGLLAVEGTVRQRLGLAFVAGLGVIAGVALAGGPWMFQLWSAYGNPFLPYFNDVFRSPWADMAPYVDRKFFPNSAWETLVYPFVFTADPLRVSEVAFTDHRVLFAFIAAPFGLLFALLPGAGEKQVVLPAARVLLLALLGAYGAWLTLFCIYRYLVPLEMLGPLAFAVLLALLPASVPRAVRGALLLAGLAVLLVTTRVADWGRSTDWPASYMDQEIPPIAEPERTLVLLTGYEPTSFTLPSFPAGLRFLRIQSNFSDPRDTTSAFDPLMREIVAAHRGPFLVLLVDPWERWNSEQGLLEYGLALGAEETCQPITGPLVVSPLKLCPATRATPPTPAPRPSAS